MKVVSNAGPLIALARIGQLELLPILYGEIRIPSAVRYETVEQRPQSPGAALLESASWLRICHVKNHIAVELLQERLDKGESEAIVLAIELSADLLLMDEARGRRIAEARGLALIGTLGTLLLAKRRGIIEKVKPLVENLNASGFRMSNDLYHSILQLAGENQP